MALSPMMQQYFRIHDEYPDCLLFFRLGDFYELFFEDAKLVSKELELTLTGKECGLEERAPMCGVPYHSVNVYLEKLIEKGYKVAICEQMEDPALAKGLVKREVIRVMTPGTVTDPTMLDEKTNNYLLSVCISRQKAGVAYADLSTGETEVMEPELSSLRAEIARISPTEIICNDTAALTAAIGGEHAKATQQPSGWFQLQNATDLLRSQFHVSHLTPLGLDEHPSAASAAGALIRYLRETQKNSLEHIRTLRFSENGRTMLLDPHTRRNLELTERLRTGKKQGTLLGLLDQTATAMGGRLLRRWVEEPLLNLSEIRRRQDAVEEMAGNRLMAMSLEEELAGVYDIERLISKVAYRNLNARDCLALGASLKRIPEIQNALQGARSDTVRGIRERLDSPVELTTLLERAIHPDAPVVITEGGIIRDGYSEELDGYREAQHNGKQWILELETEERNRTGIRNLRIQYNKVFGYYIEVTKSFLSQVPDRYIRKQTLTNAERFMTPELKEIEEKILRAQEMSVRLELELFNGVRDEIARNLDVLQRICEGVKELDVYQSLGKVAVENRYCRPEMTEDGQLQILEGRHPVVEQNLQESGFVPNDTLLDLEENRMMIITGPNMAGKSTYMRQVALICLMAQMGSFVPAAEAHIPISDQIFTRVGASDDLASGQSTFMVEMSETAFILRNATRRSLIILDEIGRGTSTFDGLAIAWAVVEYICDPNKIGAKTLFATHYHELSELEGHLSGVKNYCISVREQGENVVFLRKIIRGGADRSFGVHVARLAGVPHEVVVRAHEIQARLDVSNINQNTIGQNILGEGEGFRENQQVDLFEYRKTEIIQQLQDIDVMALTPMDAINKLFLLREMARNL